MPIIAADVVDSLPSSSSSSPGSASSNRLKFLCSHGGKILPRPTDGRLKYVAGETRVICVNRHITISELMKKLTSMFDGEMVLKYQLLPEDLDILVTVKSDEDLRHMIEECDRHEVLGAPRLRTFLFSSNNPIVIENQMGSMDHRHSLEQRYINSVNGIVVSPSQTHNTAFSASSACSSPRTPPETTTPTPPASGINPDFATSHGKPGSLSRNSSSTSLSNLYCNSPNNHQITSPNWNQNHHHHHHHHQLPPQPHQYNPQPIHSPKPPHPHKGSGIEHQGRTRSMGIGDYYRHAGGDHNNNPRTTNRGGGGHIVSYQRGSGYDDYYGSSRYESPPGSPFARSPSGGVSPSPSVKSGRW